MNERLLLDTCAIIWVMENADMTDQSVARIDQARDNNEPIYVSPISAWEVGLLVSHQKLALSLPPDKWFETLLASDNVELADMVPQTLINSSLLPGEPPKDPADRIVISTARDLDLTIITRDKKILKYAKNGHVKALVC